MNSAVHQFNARISELMQDGAVSLPGPVRESIEKSLDNASENLGTASKIVERLSEANINAVAAVNKSFIDGFYGQLTAQTNVARDLLAARSALEILEIQKKFALNQYQRNLKQSEEALTLLSSAIAEAANVITESKIKN